MNEPRRPHIIRTARKSYPMPPNPTGWYAVLESHELGRSAAVPLSYFGRELAAFRDASGRARVVDAFCPHLGTHLGHGGRVVNGELECPYHRWRFSGEGICTAIPNSSRPPNAGLHCWPVDEVNGLVWVFYDEHGRPPHYTIPEIEEWGSKAWAPFRLLRAQWEAHVIETQENFVDETHFNTIHRQLHEVTIDFETDGHTAQGHTTLKLPLPGMRADFDVTGTFIGPGFGLIRTRGPVSMTVMALPVPIDDVRSDYRLLLSMKNPGGSRALGRLANALFWLYARSDFHKEGIIWHHRTYHSRPVYSPTDRTLPKFRRWYRQFYEVSEDIEP